MTKETDAYLVLGTKVDKSGLEEGIKDIKDEVESEDLKPKLDIEVSKTSKKSIKSFLKDLGKGFLQIGKIIISAFTWLIKAIATGILLGVLVGGVLAIGYSIVAAFAKVLEENKEIIAKVKYIGFAIKQALQPLIDFFANVLSAVLNWVLDVVLEILAIIGRIIWMITGYNIFKNSGVDKFSESLKDADESAKDIKKQLAAFDEMDILEDNSSNNNDNGTDLSGALGGLPDLASEIEQGTKFEAIIDDLIDKWFELGNQMREAVDSGAIRESFGLWGYAVEGLVEMFLGLWEIITGLTEVVGGVMDIIVGIITGNEKLISEGWKFFVDGLGKIFFGIIRIIAGILETVLGVIFGVIGTIGDVVKGLFSWIGEVLVSLWNKAVDDAGKAWEKIKNIFGSVASFFGNVFGKAWEEVMKVFSTGGRIFAGITEGILEAFKRIVNVIIDGINEVVAIPFRGINTALSALRSLDLWGWKPFEWIGLIDVPRIPRLARGGIVNNPGPGVMMGNYIAGEKGPEAVLPLDDLTMDRLGQSIAKHMTINATLVNSMNGRVISKELQKINAEQDFAYNR